MAPQLPEQALVSLLRQCYFTPRCRASAIPRQTLFNSSQRALHTPHSPLHPRHRQPYVRAQSRSSCSNKIIADARSASLCTKSAGLGHSEIVQYSPSAALGERPIDDYGRQQQSKKQQVAVLGGGITGLAAAHYLSRELSNAQITVYEGSERLGGWLNSTQVDVGNGHITLEQGPRTLRPHTPASLVTLEMACNNLYLEIQHLELEDQLLITDNSSVSAQNRYVYFPDHLVRMPGPGQDPFDAVWRILTEPVFKGMALGALGEFRRPPRPHGLLDESVASFITRRLGSPHIANNIVSAVLHGIYAGDVNQLSARSLMGKMYHQEAVSGSIFHAGITAMKEQMVDFSRKDADLHQELAPKIRGLTSLRNASVYTFKKGIGALTEGLEASLRARHNVEIKLNHKVTSLVYNGENDVVQIKSSDGQPPTNFDKVVSTISGRQLSTLAPDKLPSLAHTHAVTVMVVNLYFEDPHVLPERGFGYLIPRSVPYEQNPECALGVVFDSDSVQGQDTAPGTKVTVMLGGHWWDGFDAYPDEEEGAAMAKAVLKRHLKIDEEPALVRATLQRECIPQYTVGHVSRLMSAHQQLMSEFKGKLLVAGNSYEGVGLNDCVRSARDVVMSIRDGKIATGLEEVGKDEWVKIKVSSLRV